MRLRNLSRFIAIAFTSSVTSLQAQSIEATKVVLPKLQAATSAILVQHEDGRERNPIIAARPSTISVSTKEIRSRREIFVRFNQSVGRRMSTSFDEAMKALKARHGNFPTGYEAEITFETGLVPHEDDSSVLACGIALDSMLAGAEIDPKVAYIGSVTASGAVKASPRTCERISGAASNGSSILVIPESAGENVGDVMLIDGPKALWKTQFIQVADFAQAVDISLASATRPAIDKFAEIQSVLNRSDDIRLLKNQHVVARLNEVLNEMPNHLSAKYLLSYSNGSYPRKLTPEGSFYVIDQVIRLKFHELLQRSGFRAESSSITEDELDTIESGLTRRRLLLDQDFMEVSDAIVDFTNGATDFMGNIPKTLANRRKAEELVNVKFERMSHEIEKMSTMPAVVAYTGSR